MNVSAIHPQWPSFSRWHNIVTGIGLALLALLALLGYGPGGSACKALALPSLSAPTPAVVPPLAVPPPPAAPAVATPAPPEAIPAARVYFDLDRTNLPADVDKSLADVIAYLKSHGDAKAVISGFHDPSGNRAHNEELALNRARAVRGALEAAGIPADRVVMEKPMETTGSGRPEEARRVEVAVQR